MQQSNYWTQSRWSRRATLRAAGVGTLGLGAAALIGCGADDDDSPAGTPAPGQTPQAGGTPAPADDSMLTDATLTAAIASDVGSMDPQSLGGTGGGNWPNASTHFGGAGLVTVNQETKLFEPNVADSWEEADDRMTITFHLNENVYFHNGDQLTAEDVKFSIDRNIGQAEYNPDFQAGYGAQFAGVVDNVEVVDDYTVQLNMKQPDLLFLYRPLILVPKNHVETVGDSAFAREPVGAGRFKFQSWTPDSEIRSERWEEYHLDFGAPGGVHPALIKNLVQRVIPEDGARLSALQAGEVDLIHNVSSDIARQLDADDNFNVFYLAGDQPMMIEFNTAMDIDPTTNEPNPFLDTRVRQAANYAIDIDAIIENILTGQERITFGSARGSFGFPEDLVEERFTHDPERARQLLTEAGYPNGFETTMYGPTGRWPNTRPVMEAVGQFLEEVGIRVRLREQQYQEIVTRFHERTVGPMVFFGMAGGDDPGNNFRFNYHSSANFLLGPVTEEQDEIDQLVEASEQEFDPDARAELIGEIIRKFYFQAKCIWLYEPVTVTTTTRDWQWDIWGDTLANPEYWRIRPA